MILLWLTFWRTILEFIPRFVWNIMAHIRFHLIFTGFWETIQQNDPFFSIKLENSNYLYKSKYENVDLKSFPRACMWFQGFINIRWNYLHLLCFKLIELYVCSESIWCKISMYVCCLCINTQTNIHMHACALTIHTYARSLRINNMLESIPWISTYTHAQCRRKINKLRAKSAAGNKIFSIQTRCEALS